MKKILIVEDQKGPLNCLNFMFQNAMLGKDFKVGSKEDPEKMLKDAGIEVARCYNDAKKMLQENKYDIVFLDHRMPLEDLAHLECTGRDDEFLNALKNIGYTLIPEIRRVNPECKIVGTSSLKNINLGEDCVPDMIFEKNSYEPETLRNLFEKIEGAEKKEREPQQRMLIR